jgi:hypothetical protein
MPILGSPPEMGIRPKAENRTTLQIVQFRPKTRRTGVEKSPYSVRERNRSSLAPKTDNSVQWIACSLGGISSECSRRQPYCRESLWASQQHWMTASLS